MGRPLLILAALAVIGCVGATPPPRTASQPSAAEAAVPKAFVSPPPAGTRARCPVTGEAFTVEEKTARAEHKGRHHVFCCPPCKGRFEADPARYAP